MMMRLLGLASVVLMLFTTSQASAQVTATTPVHVEDSTFALIDFLRDKSISLVDLNFDSYPDLDKLLARSWDGRSEAHDIWLFEPDSSRFVYSEAYSDRLGHYAVQTDERTLRSGSVTGCGGHCYTSHVYRPTADSLLLIERARLYHDLEKDTMMFKREKLIDGRMVVVEHRPH
jgi:hypothetical protein